MFIKFLLASKLFLVIFNLVNGACDRSLDLTPIPGTGCTQFYRCDGTTLFRFNCGPGTVFDPINRVCNWPYNVNCADSGGTTSATTTTPITSSSTRSTTTRSTSPTETTKPTTQGVLPGDTRIPCSSSLNLTPLPSDCSKYYICSSSTKTLFIQSCPGSTLFSAQLQNCLPSNFVTCPTETPTTCPLIDYTSVPGTNCTKYYICDGAIPLTIDCEAGFMFDISLKACSPAVNSCPNGVVSSSCSATDLTVVPTNCNSYNRCTNGQIGTLNCPPGTVFDSINKICDVPSNVEGYCGTTDGIDNCPEFENLMDMAFLCGTVTFKSDYPNCCV